MPLIRVDHGPLTAPPGPIGLPSAAPPSVLLPVRTAQPGPPGRVTDARSPDRQPPARQLGRRGRHGGAGPNGAGSPVVRVTVAPAVRYQWPPGAYFKAMTVSGTTTMPVTE